MKVLFAEDNGASRLLLRELLESWGYEVQSCVNGGQAWDALQQPDAPDLILLDWMMPVMDGIDVCRKTRESFNNPPKYIILLTARGAAQDITEGFRAGANDYIVKPFLKDELFARLKAGERVLHFQHSLVQRVAELQTALNEIKTLRGLIPICTYCKRIRDDRDSWRQMEAYISKHTGARFSHGVCPTCYEKFVGPQLAEGNESSSVSPSQSNGNHQD